jgi:hypothetical protein
VRVYWSSQFTPNTFAIEPGGADRIKGTLAFAA